MKRTSAAPVKFLMALAAIVFFNYLLPLAHAGMATSDLALFDGFGPDGGRWRGTSAINAGPIPLFGDQVDAVVEWAAFAPGKFQLYLNANHPGAVDPSAAGEVVYAYEVVSVATAAPGISTLTIGVDPADARGSVGPTFVPLTGGQAPSGSNDQTTSMAWFFGPGAGVLSAGEKTPILVFSSVFAPELDTLQLNSGLASPNPSPLVASISDRLFTHEIPEPTGLLLLLLGAAALALRCSRPRRR